jgi:hypothetical protein
MVMQHGGALWPVQIQGRQTYTFSFQGDFNHPSLLEGGFVYRISLAVVQNATTPGRTVGMQVCLLPFLCVFENELGKHHVVGGCGTKYRRRDARNALGWAGWSVDLGRTHLTTNHVTHVLFGRGRKPLSLSSYPVHSSGLKFL